MTKFGQPKEQRMNAVLWTIQGILAGIFAMAAFYHIHKREYREVLFNVTLFIPLAVIVFYRF
jgi:hypothetical protein